MEFRQRIRIRLQALSGLCVLLLARTSIAAAGEVRCVLPDVSVPMHRIGEIADACMSSASHDPSALLNLDYLTFHACRSYREIRDVRAKLGCLSDASGSASAMMDAIGRNAYNPGTKDLSCADARALAEKAARLGVGQAAFVLSMAKRGGWYWGACAKIDYEEAVKYLKQAADAGVREAETNLALLLIAVRNPAMLPRVGIDDPMENTRGPYYFKEMALTAAAGALEAEADERFVTLLESASRKGEPLAQNVLVAIYRVGLWVPQRPDRSLAWLALRSPEYEDVNDNSEFAIAYHSANGATREQACEHVRAWTADNANFRWYPGEPKNSFVRRCMNKEATVLPSECLDAATLRRIGRAIEPLLIEHPECRATRFSSGTAKDPS